MARLPSKSVRFLVWLSTSREYRDDALVALDEGFENTQRRFGSFYAHLWSVSQAIRSLPYGAILALIKVGISIYAFVS